MATIKKRGNSYLFRCYAGYDQYGKQIEKTMTWKIPEGMSEKKAEKEAQHQAVLFEEKVRTGQIAEEKTVKFAVFAERWFELKEAKGTRPKTIAGYKALMDRILPEFGHMYIDKIRPAHINAFYVKLSKIEKGRTYTAIIDIKQELKGLQLSQDKFISMTGISKGALHSVITGKSVTEKNAAAISQGLGKKLGEVFEPSGEIKKLTGNTILHYHRLLSSMFQTAVKQGYIVSNPVARADAPSANHDEAIFLDDTQAVELLLLMDEQPINYRTAIKILLFTGMRRGELLGLQWQDIDFEKGTIAVRRTMQYLPDRGVYLDDTKNQSSRRIIYAPTGAMQALKEYRNAQRIQFFQFGKEWSEGDQVFLGQGLEPMHPDTLTNWFGSFIKTTDLPQIHLHSLRHTNATIQIANGVAVTTVAKKLGHANANTTTKVYAHAIRSAEIEASSILDNILLAKKQA